MAQSKGTKGNKGFGSMDENRQREIAKQGGRASAQSDTSNRGFASMDKNKQREISSMGGKASHGTSKAQRAEGTQAHPVKKDELKHKKEIATGTSIEDKNLNSLNEEDERMSRRLGDASYSETDEDENEGLGDGNIGRSSKSPGADEEG
jgi:uncharacterized protein